MKFIKNWINKIKLKLLNKWLFEYVIKLDDVEYNKFIDNLSYKRINYILPKHYNCRCSFTKIEE